MKDYSFYKKNSLLRYLISKELSAYQKAKESSKKINDFVIPILSSLITLVLWYYNRELANEDASNLLITIVSMIAGYVVIYFILTYIIKRNFRELYFKIKKYFWADIEYFEKPDYKKLIQRFNFDVLNQTSLSFSLMREILQSEDLEMKKFYALESFFYLASSIDLLRSILNVTDPQKLLKEDSKYYYNNIHKYRLNETFSLIKVCFVYLSKHLDLSDKDLANDFTERVSLFNDLVDIVKSLGWFSFDKINLNSN